MGAARIEFVLSMVIVGSVGLFVRNIPLPSANIALARGVLGCLFILAFSMISKKGISVNNIKANGKVLILSGIALGLNWILLFQAFKYTTISNATICYYFAPVIVMILSPVILKEKLNAVKVLSIFAALAGLACIAGVSRQSGANDFVGILFATGAAVLYASVIFLNKRLKGVTGIESSIVQLGITAVSLFPYVLFSGGMKLETMTLTPFMLLVVVGFVHTGVVYLMYFSSIQKISGQSVAALSYIDPVVAILLSSVFLREKMTLVQIAGGILILGSTFLAEMHAQREQAGGKA